MNEYGRLMLLFVIVGLMDCADLIFFREGILNFIEGVFMNKVILTAAAVLTMGVASFAMAGGLDTAPSQAHKGGLYVGAGLGYAKTTTPKNLFEKKNSLGGTGADEGIAIGQKSKFDHFAAAAHMGYLFPVTQNFLLGAELGYNYLPENKYTFGAAGVTAPKTDLVNGTIKYSQYSIDLLGVAKYYVTDEFNIFGKAGIAYVNQKVTQSFTEGNSGLDVQDFLKTLPSISSSEAKFLPKVAVGVGYNITQNVELTAQYSHTFGDKIHQIDEKGQLFDKKWNEQMLVNASKIPSNNEVLVGANYYFNI